MSQRPVTEIDFRQPQFRDAKVEDYEFRNDGAVVRKDRWERAVQTIRELVGIHSNEFEIDDVVAKVERLVEDEDTWTLVSDENPPQETRLDIQLHPGSVLMDATFSPAKGEYRWSMGPGVQISMDEVKAWRKH